MWISLPPQSSLSLPFWNAAAAEAGSREDKMQLLSTRLQAAQSAPLAASASGSRVSAGDQIGHRYREVWTLKAKPFYLSIYIHDTDFRKFWGLCMFSLNTQVLLYICKGVRFRKVQDTSPVYWFSEVGKLTEELQCRIFPQKQMSDLD